MAKKENRIEFVYAGRRHDTKGKIIYKYEYVDLALQEKEGYALFTKKLDRLATVGSVISCIQKGDSTYGDFKLESMLEDEKRVEVFRTESTLFEDTLRREKAASKKYPSAIDGVIEDVVDIIENAHLNTFEIVQLKELIFNKVMEERIKRAKKKK